MAERIWKVCIVISFCRLVLIDKTSLGHFPVSFCKERNQESIYISISINISLITVFHRALLQSIVFISRINALDYTKLRG